MDADYIVHKVVRRIASWAVYSFFTEVRVIGGENVPANGPIVVYVLLSRLRPCQTMRLATAYGSFRTATHHNMMLDPAVLCASLRFVTTTLITLIYTIPCSLGVSSYAHIALLEQRSDLRLFHGNILTSQSSEPLCESRAP